MHITFTILTQEKKKVTLAHLNKIGVVDDKQYEIWGIGIKENGGRSLTEYSACNFLIANPHYTVKMEILDCVY